MEIVVRRSVDAGGIRITVIDVHIRAHVRVRESEVPSLGCVEEERRERERLGSGVEAGMCVEVVLAVTGATPWIGRRTPDGQIPFEGLGGWGGVGDTWALALQQEGLVECGEVTWRVPSS